MARVDIFTKRDGTLTTVAFTAHDEAAWDAMLAKCGARLPHRQTFADSGGFLTLMCNRREASQLVETAACLNLPHEPSLPRYVSMSDGDVVRNLVPATDTPSDVAFSGSRMFKFAGVGRVFVEGGKRVRYAYYTR